MQKLGFTEEVNVCDCCGKSGLKGTVVINREGVLNYYGTTCATKQGADREAIKKAISENDSFNAWVNTFIRRNKLEAERKEVTEFAKTIIGKSLNRYFER